MARVVFYSKQELNFLNIIYMILCSIQLTAQTSVSQPGARKLHLRGRRVEHILLVLDTALMLVKLLFVTFFFYFHRPNGVKNEEKLYLRAVF
jgi:hypothetical protein